MSALDGVAAPENRSTAISRNAAAHVSDPRAGGSVTRSAAIRPEVVETMTFLDLDSYLRIIEWAKEKGDTSALAGEWRFSTPIMMFPSTYDGRWKAAEPGDVIVWNRVGFDVWTRRS